MKQSNVNFVFISIPQLNQNENSKRLTQKPLILTFSSHENDKGKQKTNVLCKINTI